MHEKEGTSILNRFKHDFERQFNERNMPKKNEFKPLVSLGFETARKEERDAYAAIPSRSV